MNTAQTTLPSQLPPVREPNGLVIWLQKLWTALRAIDERLRRLEQKENRS